MASPSKLRHADIGNTRRITSTCIALDNTGGRYPDAMGYARRPHSEAEYTQTGARLGYLVLERRS